LQGKCLVLNVPISESIEPEFIMAIRNRSIRLIQVSPVMQAIQTSIIKREKSILMLMQDTPF